MAHNVLLQRSIMINILFYFISEVVLINIKLVLYFQYFERNFNITNTRSILDVVGIWDLLRIYIIMDDIV